MVADVETGIAAAGMIVDAELVDWATGIVARRIPAMFVTKLRST